MCGTRPVALRPYSTKSTARTDRSAAAPALSAREGESAGHRRGRGQPPGQRGEGEGDRAQPHQVATRPAQEQRHQSPGPAMRGDAVKMSAASPREPR